MMTPKLDATSHQWMGTLTWLNFELEYLKGCDNTVVDVLSQITTWLNLDMVKSILDGVTMGVAHWAEVHDPGIIEGDHWLEQEICVTAGHDLVQMHVTDWTKAQREDLILGAVLDWLEAQKIDLKVLLAEHTSSKEGWLILKKWQNFMIHQEALYLHSMPTGDTEDLLLFVVPKAHQVAALNSCHRNTGYQGCDHILALLRECFWWPWMVKQMQHFLKSFAHCLQHEANLPKVPQHPIVATAPMDVLHVDFTTIEVTMELDKLPRVISFLMFQDHFMKHFMAYVTPNQTAKTVAKFLDQGYISIFSSGQEPGWLGSKLYEQHHWWNVYIPWCEEIMDHTLPPANKWVGDEITSNDIVNDWEAGRRQKGWLARTSGWNSASLQCHPIHYDGVHPTLFNVWIQAQAPSQLLIPYL